jgi:hypothetical protein
MLHWQLRNGGVAEPCEKQSRTCSLLVKYSSQGGGTCPLWVMELRTCGMVGSLEKCSKGRGARAYPIPAG